MASNRFFIEDFDFSKKDQIISDKDFTHQALKVLRFKKGSKIILFSGNFKEAGAEIIDIGKSGVVISINEVFENENESEKDIVLYQSIIKKDNFERVCQKATEIGVKKIVPIVSGRTVKLDINYQRIERIIKEAAEQSGRALLSKLENPCLMKDVVKNRECDTNLFFDSSGKMVDLKNWKLENKKIGVWMGPEGGWGSEELKMAKSESFKIISLGKLTLRAETAAIIGSYIALKK